MIIPDRPKYQLQELTHLLHLLANGETELNIPFLEHENEIGDIARSIQQFKVDVIERKQAELMFGRIMKELEQKNKDLEAAKTKFEYSATHDTLTGLGNRRHFIERFDLSLEQAKRNHRKMALLFIDLDGFKAINDLFGHNAGDFLLKEISRQLQNSIRNVDIVCRTGGDEFLCLLDFVGTTEHIIEVSKRILSAVQTQVRFKSQVLSVTSSIGISVFPTDGDVADQIISKADQAMYFAKEHGKNNFHFYSDELSQLEKNRLAIEFELRDAINSKQLFLHYQPQVSSFDGRIVGLEALVRWDHPQKGIVLPESFLPVAENAGIIGSIDSWVLQEVCDEIAALNQFVEGADIKIAVNMSAALFEKADFVDFLADIFSKTNINPQSLDLELTESILMKSKLSFLDKLYALKKLGVTLSIDDFGTGYSSLNYLWQFPIDHIKIDKSFVQALNKEPKVSILIKTIIGMAKSLDCRVIAEGVESEQQEQFLLQEGCDIMQGYKFYEPQDMTQIVNLLNQSIC